MRRKWWINRLMCSFWALYKNVCTFSCPLVTHTDTSTHSEHIANTWLKIINHWLIRNNNKTKTVHDKKHSCKQAIIVIVFNGMTLCGAHLRNIKWKMAFKRNDYAFEVPPWNKQTAKITKWNIYWLFGSFFFAFESAFARQHCN